MATITNSIGTASRDYSTLQAWEDAIPANCVTAGNSYVGECYNDSAFTSTGTLLTVSAHTTDSTHTIKLTAAAGQSFVDDANVRTNRLAFDATKGVNINCTGTYNQSVVIQNTTAFITISRLQFKANSTCIMFDNSGAGASNKAIVENCILYQTVGNGYVVRLYGNGTSGSVLMRNSLVVVNHSSSDTYCVLSNGGSMVNCTIVKPSNRTTNGTAITAQYATSIVRNCAVFGFTTASAAGSTFNADGHNCTSTSTAYGTTGNVVSKLIANQFVTPSSASNLEDFRLLSTADCKDVGVTDTTNVPSGADISGQTRSTWDIGAWEYASAATGRTADFSQTTAATTVSSGATVTNQADLSRTLAATTISATASDGGVTATLTRTLAATTVSSTASMGGVTASASNTLAATTVSSTTSATDTASASNTLATTTVASTATSSVAATVSQTLGSTTLSSAVALTDGAQVSQTLASATLSSTATPTVQIDSSGSLSPTTISSTASTGTVTATLSQTLAATTLASDASVGSLPSRTADVSLTLASTTLSAGVAVGVVANESTTLSATTVSSAATVSVVANSTTTLGAVSITSAATHPVTADASITLAATTLIASTGSVKIADLNQTLAATTVSSTASAVNGASVSRTLAATSVSSSATSSVVADTNVALATATMTAAATSSVAASASVTLASTTLAATGAVAIRADSATALATATMDAAAGALVQADLSKTLAPATVTATASVVPLGAITLDADIHLATTTCNATAFIYSLLPPTERIYSIGNQLRSFRIRQENRQFKVNAQNRTLKS